MIREVARYWNYWNAEPNKIHQVQLHPDSLSLSWPLWRRSTHATPINVEVNRGVAVAANLYTAWKLSATFGCWLLLLLGFFCFFFFFNFLMLVTWNACRASRKWCWRLDFLRTHFRQILTGDRVLVLRLPLQAHLLVTLQNAVENFVRLCERFVRKDVERPLNDTQMALYCCPCSQVGALAVLAVFLRLNLGVKPFQESRQFFSGTRRKGQSNALFLLVLANDSKPGRRGTRCIPVGAFRNDSKKLFVGNYAKSIRSFHLRAVSERNSTCSGKERPALNQMAYQRSFSGEEFPYLG